MIIFTWLVQPVRVFVQALVDEDSPRQLALGLALGMVVGLVPKGNLTAAMAAVLLLSLRANLAAGALAAIGFTWIGSYVDPLSHLLGRAVLTCDFLQGVFARVYQIPLAPWTAFNNTVVMGSLLLGLVLFYPLYRLGFWAADKYRPLVVERILRYRLGKWLLGAELASRWRLA